MQVCNVHGACYGQGFCVVAAAAWGCSQYHIWLLLLRACRCLVILSKLLMLQANQLPNAAQAFPCTSMLQLCVWQFELGGWSMGLAGSFNGQSLSIGQT